MKPGTGELRHGTEGWKALETSFKALQYILEALGEEFRDRITPELLGLVYNALYHPNRFVRETGLFVLRGVVCTLGQEGVKQLGTEVAEKLRYGMSDNWS